MKIAIGTSNTGMTESLSAMFREHEWHVLGIMSPTPDWKFDMQINTTHWPHRRNVFNHRQEDEPIQKVDIGDYDLLIDVAETNDYNLEWRQVAVKWSIPRIFYVTNPTPKTRGYYIIERWCKRLHLPERLFIVLARKMIQRTHPIFAYWRKLGQYPVVYTNETLREHWGLPGDIIHFSHDEWGLGKWVGDDTRMLYGKNGYFTWAKPNGTPFEELFLRLEKKFGSKLVIHDSSVDPMFEEDLRDYVARFRVWFEHDFGSTGRALTQSVVKAMCLGLPVIVWKTNICQAWRFIENYKNGLVTESVDEVVRFAEALFYDYYYAKVLSENMVRTYRENLSWAVAKPKWEKAIKRAFEKYDAD